MFVIVGALIKIDRTSLKIEMNNGTPFQISNFKNIFEEVFERFLFLWDGRFFSYMFDSKNQRFFRGFSEVFQRFLIFSFWSTFFVYVRCYQFWCAFAT